MFPLAFACMLCEANLLLEDQCEYRSSPCVSGLRMRTSLRQIFLCILAHFSCKERDSGLSKLVEAGFWAKRAYFGPSSALPLCMRVGILYVPCVVCCDEVLKYLSSFATTQPAATLIQEDTRRFFERRPTFVVTRNRFSGDLHRSLQHHPRQAVGSQDVLFRRHKLCGSSRIEVPIKPTTLSIGGGTAMVGLLRDSGASWRTTSRRSREVCWREDS